MNIHIFIFCYNNYNTIDNELFDFYHRRLPAISGTTIVLICYFSLHLPYLVQENNEHALEKRCWNVNPSNMLVLHENRIISRAQDDQLIRDTVFKI